MENKELKKKLLEIENKLKLIDKRVMERIEKLADNPERRDFLQSIKLRDELLNLRNR